MGAEARGVALGAALAAVLLFAPAGQAQSLSGPALTVSSALGSVRVDRSACAGCGHIPEVGPPADAVLDAACGDTLRLVTTEPGATVGALVGRIAAAEGPGTLTALPLRGLTGTFRVSVYVTVPMVPFGDFSVYPFTLQVRVRGCRKPRPQDAHGWPAMLVTARGSDVKALLVSACATLGNCYRGGSPLESLQVPTLEVACGGRYAVTLAGVTSATVNRIAYPPTGNGNGVQATFPTASDTGYTKELRFEVSTSSMEYGLYRVNLSVAACQPPIAHAIADLPGSGRRVAAMLARQLGAATVKLMARFSSAPGRWFPSCSATRRELEGHVFLTTASHCFIPVDRPQPFPPQGNFRKFPTDDNVEYAIAAHTPSGRRVYAPSSSPRPGSTLAAFASPKESPRPVDSGTSSASAPDTRVETPATSAAAAQPQYSPTEQSSALSGAGGTMATRTEPESSPPTTPTSTPTSSTGSYTDLPSPYPNNASAPSAPTASRPPPRGTKPPAC